MTARNARLYADLFTALVAISIGIALAGLTWRILGDPGGMRGALVEKPRRQRAVDVDRLIALAPFGTNGAVTQPGSGDTALQLRGILLAQPRSASAALISVGGAAPAPFYVGQQVGGGTIDSIEVDRVLLRSGSRLVALAFPDRTGSSFASTAPPAVNQPNSPAPTVANASPPTNGNFVATIGAVPVAGGYRVGASLPPALRAAGLQPGDVIQRVNGTALGDAARDAALFATISAAGSAQLDLLRGGQPVSLVVSLR